MKMSEYKDIIRPMLSEKRYNHSVCVAREAVRLAKRYGADVKKAEIAGILHDIMKETPPEKQLKYMQEFGIMLTDTQRRTPKVWHQICGAGYIEHVLGITDEDILFAVRYHTTGRAGMSLLEKIIFTADYISADRDYNGVEEIRQQAYENLEAAMLTGLAFTVEELSQKRQPIAEDTFLAYNECCLRQKYGKDTL